MRAFSIGLTSLLIVGLALSGCGKKSEPAPDQPAAAGGQEQAPPPARRTLPNAEPAGAAALALDSLAKVDLSAQLASGEATLAANDERFQTSISVLVDGDVQSFAVGNGINPLELTVTLPAPINLRAARANMVGSTYDWVLEPSPGVGRRRVETVPERTWSQIDLPAAVKTSVVRFEFLRLERDDFVHVDEIELYTER